MQFAMGTTSEQDTKTYSMAIGAIEKINKKPAQTNYNFNDNGELRSTAKLTDLELRMLACSSTGVTRIFDWGGGTRPTPPSLASDVHTFEAVAGSWGSVSASAVSRVMDGAPEQNTKSIHR